MPNRTVQSQQNEQTLLNEVARLNKIIQDITERSEREARTLHSQLEELAIHDPLTGLYNRHHFNETFNRELIRAERYKLPLSVIMATIDHFKIINETYGLLAGDEVLRAFGVLVRQNCRASDVLCRYGGEEFLQVFSNMKVEEACNRAEKLRSAFAATPIICGASVIHATVSFGIAVFPEHGKAGEELIAAADAALHYARADGRNQVNLYNARMNPDVLI